MEREQCCIQGVFSFVTNNRRTVAKIFFLCDVFVTPFASHMERKNDIYQHLQDPTQENRENDILGSCYFQHCPPGVPGTDRDHLKDTQEADATNGHSPPHSVQKKVCRQNHCRYASTQRLPLSGGHLYRGGPRSWPQSGA